MTTDDMVFNPNPYDTEVIRMVSCGLYDSHFPRGTFIQSIYTGEVYQIIGDIKHNGMCDCLNLQDGSVEKHNAYANPHYVPADFVSLGIRILCL